MCKNTTKKQLFNKNFIFLSRTYFWQENLGKDSTKLHIHNSLVLIETRYFIKQDSMNYPD